MSRRRKLILALAGSYALMFSVLAFRRWACPLPWTSECLATFGRNIETAILFLWVDDWETIVAAMLAIAAAAVSVAYLRRQIAQTAAHEKRRLKRRHRAAKALMPDVLSGICGYATESAHRYSENLSAFSNSRLDRNRLNNFEAPRLDRIHIEAVQAMIEASPKLIAEPFVRLLAEMQVHDTRWRGAMIAVESQSRRLNAGLAKYNVLGEICEAAEIYASAVDLFDLVRPDNMREFTSSYRTSLSSALVQMGLIGNDELLALAIDREARRDPSTVPGIEEPPGKDQA